MINDSELLLPTRSQEAPASTSGCHTQPASEAETACSSDSIATTTSSNSGSIASSRSSGSSSLSSMSLEEGLRLLQLQREATLDSCSQFLSEMKAGVQEIRLRQLRQQQQQPIQLPVGRTRRRQEPEGRRSIPPLPVHCSTHWQAAIGAPCHHPNLKVTIQQGSGSSSASASSCHHRGDGAAGEWKSASDARRCPGPPPSRSKTHAPCSSRGRSSGGASLSPVPRGTFLSGARPRSSTTVASVSHPPAAAASGSDTGANPANGEFRFYDNNSGREGGQGQFHACPWSPSPTGSGSGRAPGGTLSPEAEAGSASSRAQPRMVENKFQGLEDRSRSRIRIPRFMTAPRFASREEDEIEGKVDPDRLCASPSFLADLRYYGRLEPWSARRAGREREGGGGRRRRWMDETRRSQPYFSDGPVW